MASNNDSTPNRGKGRPKGTPKKSKGFRGKTPNKVNTSLTHSNDISNRPIGLVNIANDCFFNSVVQALFSLESFRNYVASFEPQILHEIEPVRAMQKLFRDIDARKSNPLRTHAYLMALNLPAYEENRQFDAEECMTYIVNLFNPRINDTSSEQLNQLPENCDFLVKGDESVLCYSCNKQSNTPYGESLSQIEFPEPDVYTSVQMKIDEMTNNPYG